MKKVRQFVKGVSNAATLMTIFSFVFGMNLPDVVKLGYDMNLPVSKAENNGLNVTIMCNPINKEGKIFIEGTWELQGVVEHIAKFSSDVYIFNIGDDNSPIYGNVYYGESLNDDNYTIFSVAGDLDNVWGTFFIDISDTEIKLSEQYRCKLIININDTIYTSEIPFDISLEKK